MSLDLLSENIGTILLRVYNPLISNLQKKKIKTSFYSSVLHFWPFTRVDSRGFDVLNYFFWMKKFVQNTFRIKQINNLRINKYLWAQTLQFKSVIFSNFFLFLHTNNNNEICLANMWLHILCLLYNKFITTRVAMGKLVELKQCSWDCSRYCLWIIMNDK